MGCTRRNVQSHATLRLTAEVGMRLRPLVNHEIGRSLDRHELAQLQRECVYRIECMHVQPRPGEMPEDRGRQPMTSPAVFSLQFSAS